MRRVLLIVAAALLLSACQSAANAGCFIGATAGVIANTSRLDDGTARIDIGSQSLSIGPEVGCSIAFQGVNVGGLVRYDFTNLRAALDTASVQSPGRWMAVGTLGWQVNPSVNAYGLLGLAGTRIEVPSLASASPLGVVMGGGLTFDIGQGPISAVIEYNHIRFRGEDYAGARVTPYDNVIRMGLRYTFRP